MRGRVGSGGQAMPVDRLPSPRRAVGQMMSTMFYPLVTFVLLLICIAYWAMTALYPLPTQPGPPRAHGGWRGDRAGLAHT